MGIDAVFADYMDANEAFHAEILRLAKSDMLRRTFDLTNSLPFASPSAIGVVMPKSDGTLAIAQEHHRAILEVISEGHGTKAEAVAREHAL